MKRDKLGVMERLRRPSSTLGERASASARAFFSRVGEGATIAPGRDPIELKMMGWECDD